MSDKGVCRTAPATPGLLNINKVYIVPISIIYKYFSENIVEDIIS